ncbi:Wadjet anti-phage system protein JetA family protein [Paenibacillus sp. NPDC056933]|uniref:Wadjet anti-phage system protein JetA family protein n=1 Tax=Paenibacillus sp. NPDC056933 TaxID=3345968 RepID=UPI0036327CC8
MENLSIIKMYVVGVSILNKLEITEDNTFSNAAMTGMLQQIKNGYPVERIRKYVNSLFKENESSINSETISINNDEDFVLLILAMVRANERGMNYKVQMNNGRFDRNGYIIPNMTFSKRVVGHHVE